MRELVHTFKDGKHFLDHYTHDGQREKLFLPKVVDFSAGDLLRLEIRFEHSRYSFQTLAEVILRRLAGRGNSILTGILVSFIAQPSRSLVVAHAKGAPIPYRLRSAMRIPCTFPVFVSHRKKSGLAEAVDYSPGGIQILGGPELEVGDAVKLRLHPAGSIFGIRLIGQVVWIQREPELAYGIHLRPTGHFLLRRLNRLYEYLLARRFR
jgi:hypothetical protein